jgi:hypothetical protein
VFDLEQLSGADCVSEFRVVGAHAIAVRTIPPARGQRLFGRSLASRSGELRHRSRWLLRTKLSPTCRTTGESPSVWRSAKIRPMNSEWSPVVCGPNGARDASHLAATAQNLANKSLFPD